MEIVTYAAQLLFRAVLRSLRKWLRSNMMADTSTVLESLIVTI